MSPEIHPNLTLDPQGFRGTSTARRARQSRQRRRLRTLMFGFLLLVGVAALGWFGMQPRASGFKIVSAQILPLDLSAPAAIDRTGNLWLASQSGTLWRIDANGQSQRYGVATTAAASPLISKGGGIYVPGLNGTLTAFSTPDKLPWTRNLGAALSTTPAFFRANDAKILATGNSDGRVIGLNASNGKMLWSAQLGGPIGNALTATRNGFVAPTLASGVWRGGLVGLDGKTGRLKWRYPQRGKLSGGVAAALFVAASNRIYWNNDESSVASLDASSGRIIWETEVARADAPQSVMLRARPVLRGQSLLVGGNDGMLRSLDAGNGKARWIVDLKAPIRVLNPVRIGRRPAVLVVSEREVILVDAATGQIIGRDTGTMAWPLLDGMSAVIVGDSGSWRRVSW